MRIVIIGFSNDIHVVRWCNALSRRNNDVHLITIHTPNGQNALDENVTIHTLPNHRGLGYITGIPRLRKLIARLKPDIINTHYAEGYGTMARLAGIKPNLLSVYGHDVFEAPYRNRLYRRIITDNLRKADHIASTSHVMKLQVLRIYPQAEVSVTPFGVDTNLFAPAITNDSIKATESQPDPTTTPISQNKPEKLAKPFTFGTVKKLEDKYGIDTLIRGFALLVNKHPDTPLALEITGDGVLRDSLTQLCKDLGIADSTTIHHAVPHRDVPDKLRRLDVYVAASRSHGESFGVAVIEAMACGVPVIVTNVGGLPEVTNKGEYGMVVEPDNPQELCVAMEKLLIDRDYRETLSREGREHILETYQWDACVEDMLAVYRKVSKIR